MNLLIRQLKILGKGLGRVLWGQSRLQKLRKARVDARFERAKEEARIQSEAIKQIRSFPKKQMTRKEYSLLPKGEEVDLINCPNGTLFACKPLSYFHDVVVVGHVIPWQEAIAEQWGGGMSIPSRLINRYQVVFID